jgi:hypothetical protein
MPTPYAIIYHRIGSLEYETKYFNGNAVAPATFALGCADAEVNLVSNQVHFNRWEHFGTDGKRNAYGSFSGLFGSLTDDMLPIHYALLIQFESVGAERPSYKFVHGYTKMFVGHDGLENTNLATALAAYELGLLDAEVCDTEGSAITGLHFSKFTYRHKMRQVAE